MYYSFQCPYCRKTFYTFTDNKQQAASTLYHGIIKHQKDYGEDEKEHTLDNEHLSTEVDRVYKDLDESDNEPSGGYEI